MKNFTAWLTAIVFLAFLALLAIFLRAAKGAEPPPQAPRPPQAPLLKGDVFTPKNAARQNCYCSEPGQCACDPARCQCPVCAAKGPRVGDTMVTDDPARPWTYGYGREYGWDELGWYRPVARRPRPATTPGYYGAQGVYQQRPALVRPGASGGCSS